MEGPATVIAPTLAVRQTAAVPASKRASLADGSFDPPRDPHGLHFVAAHVTVRAPGLSDGTSIGSVEVGARASVSTPAPFRLPIAAHDARFLIAPKRFAKWKIGRASW